MWVYTGAREPPIQQHMYIADVAVPSNLPTEGWLVFEWQGMQPMAAMRARLFLIPVHVHLPISQHSLPVSATSQAHSRRSPGKAMQIT